MGDFNGRSIGWLVGWCLCVFTSDVKSLFVGSSRVPLRSIQALVPKKTFSDPFISPREQGAFVFSFAKMQHRYLRRCRWYSFELAKSHPPLTLVPIDRQYFPSISHLPLPDATIVTRIVVFTCVMIFVITTCSSTSTSTSSPSTSSNSPSSTKVSPPPNLLNYTPAPAPRHRPLSQQHSPSP